MINSQFFKDCGLILLNEDNVKNGIAEEYIWTFPGLEMDWVVQSSATKNECTVISEFVIYNKNAIYTRLTHNFYIEEPNDLIELKNYINQLNIKYKNTKELLLLESIKNDFH